MPWSKQPVKQSGYHGGLWETTTGDYSPATMFGSGKAHPKENNARGNHTENTTEWNKPGPRWEAPGPPPWVPGPPSPLLCHREMLRWAPILPSSGPCGHPRALAHPPQAIRGLVS